MDYPFAHRVMVTRRNNHEPVAPGIWFEHDSRRADPTPAQPPRTPSHLSVTCACGAPHLIERRPSPGGGALSRLPLGLRVWAFRNKARLEGAAWASIGWAVAWLLFGTWMWFCWAGVLCEVAK